MYKRIKNLQELETFLCSTKGMELFGEDNQKVKAEMHSLIEMFDTSYGSNRKIDADLGGWLGIIIQTVKKGENEPNEMLGYYEIPPLLHEFEDIHQDTSDHKLQWVVRTYIASSDYSVVAVYRTYKGVN